MNEDFEIPNTMIVIPLERNSYHCLDDGLVFDPKLGSFKGDFELGVLGSVSSGITLQHRMTSDFFSAFGAYGPLNLLCKTKASFLKCL